jgi:hypothetical protein
LVRCWDYSILKVETNYIFSLISFAVFSCQFAVKRKAVGIWGCKDCGKVKAGGAYTMKYFLGISHFSV